MLNCQVRSPVYSYPRSLQQNSTASRLPDLQEALGQYRKVPQLSASGGVEAGQLLLLANLFKQFESSCQMTNLETTTAPIHKGREVCGSRTYALGCRKDSVWFHLI